MRAISLNRRRVLKRGDVRWESEVGSAGSLTRRMISALRLRQFQTSALAVTRGASS